MQTPRSKSKTVRISWCGRRHRGRGWRQNTLILGILLGLSGLIGCQPAPAPVTITYSDSPELAFQQFIMQYYANKEATLRDKYADDRIENDAMWDVTITVKQASLTTATHGVVLYTITERWEHGLQGAEGIQPVVSHWEKTDTQWRLVGTRKGRSIKSYWNVPDD